MKPIKVLTLCLTLLCLLNCMTVKTQKYSNCIYGNCKDGFGIFRDKNGIYIGTWKSNKKTGNGIYHYDENSYCGRNIKYIGNWIYGQKNGKGKIIIQNWSLTGFWVNDELQRAEKIVWEDGSSYKGNFCKLQNYYFYNYNKTKIKDYNKYVLPEGKGTYISHDGIKYEGIFRNFFDLSHVRKARKYNSHYYGKGVLITSNLKYQYKIKIKVKSYPIIFKIIEISEFK